MSNLCLQIRSWDDSQFQFDWELLLVSDADLAAAVASVFALDIADWTLDKIEAKRSVLSEKG